MEGFWSLLASNAPPHKKLRPITNNLHTGGEVLPALIQNQTLMVKNKYVHILM
jgi:hypothetical protein